MSRKLLIGWCLMPFFTFAFFLVFAQKEPVLVSCYYDLYSMEQNFSAIAFVPYSNCSLFSENRFLLKEMNTATFSGSYYNKGNTAAVSVSHFGYSKYGVFTISSGFARSFANRVSFGLRVHYIMHHADTYPQKHSFTFDLSLCGHISQKIGIGASVYNPANLRYGLTDNEKIPICFFLMLDYKINDKVLVACTVFKQVSGFLDISGTICFKEKFYGFMIDTSVRKVSTRFSFWWKRLQFDLGGSFDYRLGFSPSVNIVYLVN